MRTNELSNLLPDMYMFVRVVEVGSFTRAAMEYGRTPSAVSRQISRLESALGIQLLVRTTRKLQLSEPGFAVYRAAEEMVAAARTATNLAEKFVEAPRGLVRLSAPMTFGKVVVGPEIASFLATYEEVDVQLIFTDRFIDLVDESVDIAIRITETPPLGVIAKPLMPIRYVLCASKDYLKKHGAINFPQDLSNKDCLFFGDDNDDNIWRFTRAQETLSVSVHGRLVVNHSEAMLHAITQNVGIGLLPHFTARTALEEGKVKLVLPHWELITPYQGIAWLLYGRNRYMPQKVRVLIDHLTERFSTF